MPFKIKVEKPKNFRAVISRAKKDAERCGISYEGNDKSGRIFGHGFEGTYAINTSFIIFTINEKPWFVNESRAEKEIRKYIS